MEAKEKLKTKNKELDNSDNQNVTQVIDPFIDSETPIIMRNGLVEEMDIKPNNTQRPSELLNSYISEIVLLTSSAQS